MLWDAVFTYSFNYSAAFNTIELSKITKSTQNGTVVFLEFYDNIFTEVF